jgi:serine O-acetyltransferase
MSLIMSLKKDALVQYLKDQLRYFFPDGLPTKGIEENIDLTLDRLDHCFSAVHDRYFKVHGNNYFNHLNGDQYAMFLYFLSNTLYRNTSDIHLCEKIFYLNKLLHGIDVFYSIELPHIFLFCHPVGTVLGKAHYSDFFLVYQNCTVGSNHYTAYPVLGKHVALYKGSSILGKCIIGDNCKISAHSLIMDRDLENNKIYIGTPTNYIIKECKYHDVIWDTNK